MKYFVFFFFILSSCTLTNIPANETPYGQISDAVVLSIGRPQIGNMYVGEVQMESHFTPGTFHQILIEYGNPRILLTAYIDSRVASHDGENIWIISGQHYHVVLQNIERSAGPPQTECDTAQVFVVEGKEIDCREMLDSITDLAPVPWTVGGGPYSYWNVVAIEPALP